jgi:hypothetical protein
MHVLLSTLESLQKLPRKILAAEELSDNNASDSIQGSADKDHSWL